MTEEEETAAGTSSLTSLEDLVTIGARIERLLNLLKVDIIHGTHPLENAGRESGDLGAWQSHCSLASPRPAEM